MKIIRILVLSIFLMLHGLPLCSADSIFIGIIKTANQDAFVIRKGETMAASVNMRIMIGDVLKTGPNGAVGFILKDDTVMSMGPGSQIVISEFAFDPVAKKLSLIARLLHGSLTYLPGQIVKLSPEAVRLETPVAAISMAETPFLVKADEEKQ